MQKNIPNGWQKLELSSFFSISNNKFDPKKKTTKLPCIELEHLQQGTPLLLGTADVDYQKSTKNIFNSGDVLFGKLRPYLRKLLLANFDGICSSEIWVLKNSEKTINKFIFYFIQTEKFISHANVSSGSKMPRSDWSYLKNVSFPLPPLPEQNRIVAVLEVWDTAIEKLTRKIELKQNIKKNLMQQLLTGKNRLPGFTGEWQDARVGDVFRFLRSYSFSREKLLNNGSHAIGIGNIHYGDIHSTYNSTCIDLNKISVPMIKDTSFSPNHDDFLIDGDLIMADASEDYEGVGVTVSVHELGDKRVVSGLHTFGLRDNSGLTYENYRQYIFYNSDVKNKLRKIASGVSVYGISKTNLSNLSIALPPLSEQTAIANILTTADDEITELEKKLALIKEQKKYLLNNLVTGTIRTPTMIKGLKDD